MILGRRVCAEAERHDGMFRVTLIDKEDLKNGKEKDCKTRPGCKGNCGTCEASWILIVGSHGEALIRSGGTSSTLETTHSWNQCG